MTSPQYAPDLKEKEPNPLWWVFRLGTSNRFKPGKGTLKKGRLTNLRINDAPPPEEQPSPTKKNRRAQRNQNNSSTRPLSQQEVTKLKAKFAHLGAGRVYMNDNWNIVIIDGTGAHTLESRMDKALRERAFSTVAGLESIQENLRQKATSCLESFRKARADKTIVTPRALKPKKPINPLPCTIVLADHIDVDPEEIQAYAQDTVIKIAKKEDRDTANIDHYKKQLGLLAAGNTQQRFLVIVSNRGLMNVLKRSLKEQRNIKERISFLMVSKDIDAEKLTDILGERHAALTNLIHNPARLHVSFKEHANAHSKALKPAENAMQNPDTKGYHRTPVHVRRGGNTACNFA